jgi:hypothetical protein
MQTGKPFTATSFKYPASSASRSTRMAKDSNISQAAQSAFAAILNNATAAANSSATNPADAKLAEIKSKNAVNRTAADTAYLWANDKKLAEIAAQGKSPDKLTAEELDYMQKATGFVNTMANLSPAEKKLYDKATANGNPDAASGLGLIALTRISGHAAGGREGSTYDPINTEITADNVRNYFSYSIVDPTGKVKSQFDALIRFLESNPAQSQNT